MGPRTMSIMSRGSLLTLLAVIASSLSVATVMAAGGDDDTPPGKQWKPMKRVDVPCVSNADCGTGTYVKAMCQFSYLLLF